MQPNQEMDMESLAAATGRVATDLAERSTRLEALKGPSRLGETYFFPKTADYGVEWTVAERRPDDDHLLVLPVDDFAFAGSHDVALEEASLGGIARVRCDLGVWLEPSVFVAEQRTGALPAEDLARVRARRRDVLENRLKPILLEIQADEDPQYKRWRETNLLPAVAELSTPPPIDKPLPFLRVAASLAWPVALAASLLLAVGLAFRTQDVHQLEEALQAEQQKSQEIASVQAELEEQLSLADAAKRQLDATLEELRESSETAIGDLRRQLAERSSRILELTEVIPDRPLQLPFFELQGWERDRSSRGLPVELDLSRDAKLLAMAIEVEDPEPYLRYRLQIVARHSDEVVWQTDELIKQGRWLSVVLPSGFLEVDTQYELRLAGRMSDEVTELKESYLIVPRR